MSTSPDESGRIIGDRYYLLRRVGRGGCGVVYMAEDLARDVPVAVKVARRTNSRTVRDFQNEAAQLSATTHPHVVQFHELGHLPDGRPFIVLEWISGLSLETLVSNSPIVLADALIVAGRTADVLVALHARAVLHADIKPRNLIVPTTAQGTPRLEDVKIIDFGITREMTSRGERGELCTDFGYHAGTPDYMAPEQMSGRRQGTATDLFGLGATLFFMLYRRPPMGESTDEIPRVALSLPRAPALMMGPFITRRLTEEVQLPMEPDYPAPVKTLLTHLLRRDPGERIQSAVEARERIAHLEAVALHV